MTDDKVEVTALGDTLREFQQAYVTVGDHKVIMGGGRNIGKTIAGRIALEQGVIPAMVMGVDSGSKEHVITYAIDESDNLLEAMALTVDSFDIYNDNVAETARSVDYKSLEERMLAYYGNADLIDWKTIEAAKLNPREFRERMTERIPVSDSDIYKVRHGNGRGSRGPKGGGAQRLAKRRKANKAARKARRK